MTKNKIKLILAAMVFGLAACHDTEEVTLQNGVRVAPAVYSTEQVTTEPVEEGGEAQTKEVPTLTARYYCNSDEYATPTSVGFVYTTDPEKDPTLLDNVITGVTYDEEVAAPAYSPNRTETGYFIKAEIPEGLLETYGVIFVRAYYTAYGKTTYYSIATVAVGEDQKLPAELKNYVGPAYPDNYTQYSAWRYRGRWNLANVHDPSVMLADDGYFYMYQTDASYGNSHDGHGHFFCRRSMDLVNWEYLGATMEKCPDWVLPKVNEMRAEANADPISNIADNEYGYWAPTVRNLGNGTYRMYYSIVIPGYMTRGSVTGFGERGIIGMMETTNPADPTSWVDKGYVISSPTHNGTNWTSQDLTRAYWTYNCIDPSYIITPEGEHWLIYGSWHSGIVEIQINPQTGMPLHELGTSVCTSLAQLESNGYGKRIYSRVAGSLTAAGWQRWQGSEGPEIIYNPATGYYYLFMAYDELAYKYNTRVLRSKSINGPFLDITGADRTANPGVAYPIVTHPYKWFYSPTTWVGISHVAVFADAENNWYLACQGRMEDSDNASLNANMLCHLRRILWTEDGWPIVVPERYGAVPQVPIKTEEIAGMYDFIDLFYTNGKSDAAGQDIACQGVATRLLADGTVRGTVYNGQKWTFDEASSTLTIGSQKFIVTREVDYDSDARKPTIVFCAYSSNGQHTYWGKRKF